MYRDCSHSAKVSLNLALSSASRFLYRSLISSGHSLHNLASTRDISALPKPGLASAIVFRLSLLYAVNGQAGKRVNARRDKATHETFPILSYPKRRTWAFSVRLDLCPWVFSMDPCTQPFPCNTGLCLRRLFLPRRSFPRWTSTSILCSLAWQPRKRESIK